MRDGPKTSLDQEISRLVFAMCTAGSDGAGQRSARRENVRQWIVALGLNYKIAGIGGREADGNIPCDGIADL